MLASKFIEAELNAFVRSQNLNNYDLVALIVRAFEAYDEYRRLVSTKGRPFKEMDY